MAPIASWFSLIGKKAISASKIVATNDFIKKFAII
jgi:hypothetical protein